MSNFEFVFSLLGILLGLGLAELLGGLARMMKRRPRVKLGWATGLLATFTTLETVLFWRVVWRARNNLPDQSPALLAGFVICALYYFACALTFPDEFEGRENLDGYFMEEKGRVVGALLAAQTLAYGLRPLVMGEASWSYMAWFDWASLAIIYVAGFVAILARRLNLATAAVAVLAALDVLDPIEAILSPN